MAYGTILSLYRKILNYFNGILLKLSNRCTNRLLFRYSLFYYYFLFFFIKILKNINLYTEKKSILFIIEVIGQYRKEYYWNVVVLAEDNAYHYRLSNRLSIIKPL